MAKLFPKEGVVKCPSTRFKKKKKGRAARIAAHNQLLQQINNHPAMKKDVFFLSLFPSPASTHPPTQPVEMKGALLQLCHMMQQQSESFSFIEIDGDLNNEISKELMAEQALQD